MADVSIHTPTRASNAWSGSANGGAPAAGRPRISESDVTQSSSPHTRSSRSSGDSSRTSVGALVGTGPLTGASVEGKTFESAAQLNTLTPHRTELKEDTHTYVIHAREL